MMLAVVLFGVSCSDDPNSTGNRVIFTSGIVENEVKPMISPKNPITLSDDFADSLFITDFKMLVSRLKFHGGNTTNDTTFDDSKALKFVTGAFVVRSDSANTTVNFAESSLKAGTYNKVKIEMHRLATSELSSYSNKPYFADFTKPERPTIVVRGNFYKNGFKHAFVYTSDIVLNYTFNLNPPIEISSTENYKFAFEFDPTILFRDDHENIYIPDNSGNKSKIEKNIKMAMKLLKK